MSMIGKALAGTMLGFIFSACALAWGLWWMPAHGQAVLIPALIGFFPLWLAVIAATFMFRRVQQAWLILGLLDLLCYGGLQLLHRGWSG